MPCVCMIVILAYLPAILSTASLKLAKVGQRFAWRGQAVNSRCAALACERDTYFMGFTKPNCPGQIPIFEDRSKLRIFRRSGRTWGRIVYGVSAPSGMSETLTTADDGIGITGDRQSRLAGGELGANSQVPGKRLGRRIIMSRIESGEHVDALSVYCTLRA